MEESIHGPNFATETTEQFPSPAFYEVQAMASCQMLSKVDTLIDAMLTSLCLAAPDSSSQNNHLWALVAG